MIVQQALDPIATRLYRDGVMDWFARLDARVAAGEDNHFLDVYRVQSGMCLSPSADQQSEAPRSVRDILLLLTESGLITLCKHLYEEPLSLVMEVSSIRRQKPGESHKALGFHQDGAVVGFHNNTHTGLVFWIPLTDVDSETPGLELAPRAPRKYLRHHVNPKNGYIETTEPVVGETVTLTDLEIGDIAIFLLHTLHRTHVTPSMTRTRFSVDLRAIPTSLLRVSSRAGTTPREPRFRYFKAYPTDSGTCYR